MDAVEFLRARRKLCNDNVCEESCPLFYCCDDDIEDNRIRQVLAVEQWTKEHPIKTRQSELLQLFPNAKIDNTGTLSMCPMNFDQETYKDKDKCFCIHMHDDINCAECRRDFWLKEIE